MVIYDSTCPSDIPPDVEAVAGYSNGIYGPAHATYGVPCGWDDAGWARFSGKKIRISIVATEAADALDVESYDALPGQAPGWVRLSHAAGIAQPWVYCNRSNRSAVESALTVAGVLANEVALWVATLDGTQSVPSGPYPVAAVQYANSTISGGHYDLSVVTAYGAASATLAGVQRLRLIRNPNTGAIAAYDELGKRHINPIEEGLLASPEPNGYGDIWRDINQEQWDAVPDAPVAQSASAPIDLSGINASLTALNAKVDLIAARLAKDLA